MPKPENERMSLFDLVLPPGCVGCGVRGSLLCSSCRRALRPAGSELDRFVAVDAGVIVGDALRCALAAYAYEGPMRRALAALKYTGVRRAAPLLAELAIPALALVLAISGPAALVPVPVHAERRAERGYNQAELIASALGSRLDLAIADVLVRSHATTRQHRLNRNARLANLRGAITAPTGVPPVAILVDDIITTSATLEACASTLRSAGCDSVYGVAVAREI